MKKLVVILLGFLVLNSCSNNNSSDMIVGQWVMTQRFESDIEVDIGCSEYTYVEYRADGSITGDYIDLANTPDECANLTFIFLQWSKAGINNYNFEIGNEVISSGYFEGDNLIIESQESPFLWVYSRLE